MQKAKHKKKKQVLLESFVKQRRRQGWQTASKQLIGLIEKAELCSQSCIYSCVTLRRRCSWCGGACVSPVTQLARWGRQGRCLRSLRHQCAFVDFGFRSETLEREKKKRRREHCVSSELIKLKCARITQSWHRPACLVFVQCCFTLTKWWSVTWEAAML